MQLITLLAGLRLNYNKCIMKYLNFQQWDGSAASFPCQHEALLTATLFPLHHGAHCLSLNTSMSVTAHGDQTPGPGMAVLTGGCLWWADPGWLPIKIDLDS